MQVASMRWMWVVLIAGSGASVETALAEQPAVEPAGRVALPCYPVTIDGIAPAARVPANLAWFVATNPLGEAPSLTLRRVASGERVSIEIAAIDQTQFKVSVPEGLDEGEQYMFLASYSCRGTEETARFSFEVGPALPLPDSLGTTVVRGPWAVWWEGLPELSYYLSVRLEADPAFRPWAPFHATTIEMDGAPIAGLPQDDGSQLLYIDCDAPALISTQVGPGSRRVSHEAVFPGDSTVLSTDAVTVDVDCGAAVRVDETGRPLDPLEIEQQDAHIRAAAEMAMENGSRGCSATGGSRAPGAGAFAFMCLALWATVAARRRAGARVIAGARVARRR